MKNLDSTASLTILLYKGPLLITVPKPNSKLHSQHDFIGPGIEGVNRSILRQSEDACSLCHAQSDAVCTAGLCKNNPGLRPNVKPIHIASLMQHVQRNTGKPGAALLPALLCDSLSASLRLCAAIAQCSVMQCTYQGPKLSRDAADAADMLTLWPVLGIVELLRPAAKHRLSWLVGRAALQYDLEQALTLETNLSNMQTSSAFLGAVRNCWTISSSA